MKTIQLRLLQFTLILFTASFQLSAWAQEGLHYKTVSGIVKDEHTKKELGYVSIAATGTNVATITNEDGAFSIKINDSLQVKQLEISRLGYTNQVIHVSNTKNQLIILLTPNSKSLKEVVVDAVEPLALVKNAISKIADNNSSEPNLLTGFYRETVKKRSNYISISEAILNIYKTPYTQGTNRDEVQIQKGRKLLSPKPGDTLIVKLQGGPSLSTYLDIVKNKEFILNIETIEFYKFTMKEHVMIDERLHYVVSFEPQVTVPYALFYGQLYIDRENLTFSRAEFNLSMNDKNKATKAMLAKKPYKMKFRPEGVSYLVTYKEHDGKSYLNYIRNEIKFKSEWKRRFLLFSPSYTVTSEMVVTNRKRDNVERIPNKLVFSQRNSLSDKIQYFYDSNFWEDYNIIEPTESLESAVNKLKKQNE